jgi:hypothetical protein
MGNTQRGYKKKHHYRKRGGDGDLNMDEMRAVNNVEPQTEVEAETNVEPQPSVQPQMDVEAPVEKKEGFFSKLNVFDQALKDKPTEFLNIGKSKIANAKANFSNKITGFLSTGGRKHKQSGRTRKHKQGRRTSKRKQSRRTRRRKQSRRTRK